MKKNLIVDIIGGIISLSVFVAGCIYLPVYIGGYGFAVAAALFFALLFVVGWINKEFVK